MNDVTNRFHFLVAPENQDWARDVLGQDAKLRRGERTRLDVALDFPDLFEQGPYDHILYKVLRRSENAYARDLAADLRTNISRFGRFENFWQKTEQRHLSRPFKAEDSGMVRMPIAVPQQGFRQPLIQPIPATVGISVLLSALTIAH